mgnify:FL=1
MRFQDRTIIVTGGASGIGRATIERALEEGAAIVAVDQDAAGLQDLAAAHPGAALKTLTGDTSDSALAVEGVRLAGSLGRPVKGLVTAAGISASSATQSAR